MNVSKTNKEWDQLEQVLGGIIALLFLLSFGIYIIYTILHVTGVVNPRINTGSFYEIGKDSVVYQCYKSKWDVDNNPSVWEDCDKSLQCLDGVEYLDSEKQYDKNNIAIKCVYTSKLK